VVDGSAVRSIPRVSCVAGARESSGSGGGAGGSCKSTIVGPARHASAIINGWKRKRKKKKNGQSFQIKSSPFELIQDRLPVHTCPFPEYPVLQAHVNVSDPVELHVDPSSAQLLFPFVQLLIIVASVGVETVNILTKLRGSSIRVQTVPFPVKSEAHEQLYVPGPVEAHVEPVGAQLFTPFVQLLMAAFQKCQGKIASRQKSPFPNLCRSAQSRCIPQHRRRCK